MFGAAAAAGAGTGVVPLLLPAAPPSVEVSAAAAARTRSSVKARVGVLPTVGVEPPCGVGAGVGAGVEAGVELAELEVLGGAGAVPAFPFSPAAACLPSPFWSSAVSSLVEPGAEPEPEPPPPCSERPLTELRFESPSPTVKVRRLSGESLPRDDTLPRPLIPGTYAGAAASALGGGGAEPAVSDTSEGVCVTGTTAGAASVTAAVGADGAAGGSTAAVSLLETGESGPSDGGRDEGATAGATESGGPATGADGPATGADADSAGGGAPSLNSCGLLIVRTAKSRARGTSCLKLSPPGAGSVGGAAAPMAAVGAGSTGTGAGDAAPESGMGTTLEATTLEAPRP